jgi:hypothetical protein
MINDYYKFGFFVERFVPIKSVNKLIFCIMKNHNGCFTMLIFNKMSIFCK